jgi:hypothetical protein
MVGAGHVVRITTRAQAGRAAIEAAGAECFRGTPDRLDTLRAALENVTIACWLLATATGAPAQVHALHGSRLEFFLGQAIDTTVRGFVYEASGTTVPGVLLARGERLVRTLGERNAIPVAILTADPRHAGAWLAQAHASVDSLLEGGLAGRRPPARRPQAQGRAQRR